MHLVEGNFYGKVSISKKYSTSKDRERSCEEKIRYKTEIKAAQVAIDYNRSIVIKNADVQPYKCRYCMGWHTGHDYGDWKKRKQMAFQEAESAILLLLSPSRKRLALNMRTEIFQTSMRGKLSAAA